MRRILCVLLLASAVALAGCSGGISGGDLKPVVKPPAVGKAGVLRAAVDDTYPPFAGVVKGEKAGLDVDMAAALASRLGLKLELVPARADTAASLVKDRKADVALAAMTVEQAVAGDVSFAGTYVSDAPGLFTSKAASLTIDALGDKRIAVQKDSYAYWLLVDEYGGGNIIELPTLRDALSAVTAGEADVAAGDAIVGAYILRDMPSLHYSGQLAPAYPLGVLVSKDNPTLEAKVRSALDDMAAKGVLSTLRRKWAGDLPTLQSDSTAAGESSPTP